MLHVAGGVEMFRLVMASWSPRDSQCRVLRKILTSAKDSDFGREHKFQEILAARNDEVMLRLFRHNVKPSEYEDFRPYVNRMRQGAKNVLFEGTIRSNMLWGDENADESVIRQAADIAQASPFVEKLPEGYETDILRMKECGFNMLRKHIKIEPDLFYYECDRLGMAVFQDIPNSGRYSFLHDTALATAGLGRERRRVSARRRGYFEDALAESVRFLYNKPCVFWYTLFNEGWGQYDSGRLYDELKALDPTRVIDTASGWFKPGKTDVNSKHIYFKEIKLPYERDKVTALTEFGGYAHRVEGHCFNKKKAYGYRSYPELGEYRTAVKELYGNHVLPEIAKGLVATVYTQLSDVEDEINGLLTYDRQVPKDAFYFYKAQWNPEPMVHICSKRDTERKESLTIRASARSGAWAFSARPPGRS